MIVRPALLGGSDLVAWRLDRQRHAAGWASGAGAAAVGGRWNSRSVRAVYCALDAATAILEVAVHKGFRVLDTEPHVLTSLVVRDPATVHVVEPGDVPNPNWLRPGAVSAGQQAFGDALLARHLLVALPSVITHSWNLVFDATRGAAACVMRGQEAFALDPRLHPPAA